MAVPLAKVFARCTLFFTLGKLLRHNRGVSKHAKKKGSALAASAARKCGKLEGSVSVIDARRTTLSCWFQHLLSKAPKIETSLKIVLEAMNTESAILKFQMKIEHFFIDAVL